MWGYGFLASAARLLEFVGKPLFILVTAILIVVFAVFSLIGKLVIFLAGKTLYFLAVGVFKASDLSSLLLLRLLLIRQNIGLRRFRFPRLPPIRTIFFLLFLLFVGIFIIVFGLSFFLLRNLPKPGELITRKQELSTKIYDKRGQLLFKVYRNKNRSLVKLESLPSYVKAATVAIEDRDFYRHPGFSVRGILRALFRNLTRGELTGGSTITQQLVKNTLLTPEKSLIRKIKEIILATKVELAFSKDQILEMYLNEVAYGGATYGIEEASQTYFGKSASSLSVAEAALLAGLPRAPTSYSPFGAQPYLARARQLETLSKMVAEGYITQTEGDEASVETLHFAPQRTDIKAPHFVMYVKSILAQKYGDLMVEEGGLEVYTTLDLGVQEKVQEIVSQEVEKIGRLRISNGAALVTSPQTGEILAMVGSKNYFDTTIDGNFNVTTALRQPGSAIKPVNYSYALESKKYTAASLLADTPITYSIPGSPPYSPRNYDNKFHGNIPLRAAFASSFNVPAVKVLASYGVGVMIEQGRKMGITSWEDPANYGLSLTLGGGEVKMTDMAVVYGTLATSGERVDLNPISEVRNYRGRVLEFSRCLGSATFGGVVYAAEAAREGNCRERVLDPRAAFIITDILRDNSARALAFGLNSLLNIPGHSEVAVKTGTTQNLRDNWAIGYTKDYVVAAWVGNNDNTPMAYVASGVTGATPIWNKIMSYLLEGRPNHSWEKPDGIVEVSICPFTGTLPCEGCPIKTEYFLEGTVPTSACRPEDLLPKEPSPSPNPQIL